MWSNCPGRMSSISVRNKRRRYLPEHMSSPEIWTAACRPAEIVVPLLACSCWICSVNLLLETESEKKKKAVNGEHRYQDFVAQRIWKNLKSCCSKFSWSPVFAQVAHHVAAPLLATRAVPHVLHCWRSPSQSDRLVSIFESGPSMHLSQGINERYPIPHESCGHLRRSSSAVPSGICTHLPCAKHKDKRKEFATKSKPVASFLSISFIQESLNQKYLRQRRGPWVCDL